MLIMYLLFSFFFLFPFPFAVAVVGSFVSPVDIVYFFQDGLSGYMCPIQSVTV